jgi:hypothetical protein
MDKTWEGLSTDQKLAQKQKVAELHERLVAIEVEYMAGRKWAASVDERRECFSVGTRNVADLGEVYKEAYRLYDAEVRRYPSKSLEIL